MPSAADNAVDPVGSVGDRFQRHAGIRMSPGRGRGDAIRGELDADAALVVPLFGEGSAAAGMVGDARLRGLVDALPDGLVIVDQDGRLVFANRRLEEMSGYSADELRGQSIELLVPDRMRDLHVRHRTRYTASPSVRPMGAGLNIRLRRRDGSEFSADISLSPLTTGVRRLALATVRDVTDRREAEERLRRSEERFRLLVEWVQDYAIVMLEPDGRLASWNLGAQRITGYDAEEVIGRPIGMLYTPGDIEAGRPELQLQLARDEGRAVDEGWRLRKDGTRFWASVVLTALPGEDGELRGFAKVIRDMSERRQASARLEAINEITRAILESRRTDEVLQIVATRGRELVAAAVACVVVPGDAPGELVVRVADGELAQSLVGTVIAGGQSLAGEVLAAGEPRMTLDATHDPRAHRALARAAGFGPSLLVPLASEERVYGTLAVSHRRGTPPFTEDDLRSLELFALQSSVALEHGHIRGELQRLAIVEDRERIARELHDGIVQSLFAVGLGLLSAEPLAMRDPVRQSIHEAVDSIDRVIADLRRYIFGLKPQGADGDTLGQGIAALAEEFQARTQLVTVVEVDRRLEHVTGALVGEVLQVARESLSNVARHAHATTCRVSLVYEAPHAVLVIDDDGRGFDPTDVPGHGYGMANLRERAAGMGGSLEISSQPGQGTTLRLRFPVEAPAPRDA
jgi:PAS domain S-box-containing protein